MQPNECWSITVLRSMPVRCEMQPCKMQAGQNKSCKRSMRSRFEFCLQWERNVWWPRRTGAWSARSPSEHARAKGRGIGKKYGLQRHKPWVAAKHFTLLPLVRWMKWVDGGATVPVTPGGASTAKSTRWETALNGFGYKAGKSLGHKALSCATTFMSVNIWQR